MKLRQGIVQAIRWRRLRIICALALAISIVAPWPFFSTVVSAFSYAWRASSNALLQSNAQESAAPAPQRNNAPRIKLAAGNTVEVSSGEPITSTIVLDPEIATAEVKG